MNRRYYGRLISALHEAGRYENNGKIYELYDSTCLDFEGGEIRRYFVPGNEGYCYSLSIIEV